MSDRHERGMAIRRRVLGDEHVEAAERAKTAFDAPFQSLITESAWGTVWASDAIPLRERSMLTLALLAACGNFAEIPMHVRATARTGASERDVLEAFQHVAIYAGVPKANHAIRLARETFREMAEAPPGPPGEPSGAVPPRDDDAGTGAFHPRDPGRHPPADTPGYRSSRHRAPRHALVALPESVRDTTGPVFGHADVRPIDADLLHNHAAPGRSAIGERIILHGRVLDENARPVPGTLVEIWQANAGGRYRHVNDTYLAPLDPDFGGCGRTLTDEDGRYRFLTVKPGAYPWPNGPNDWRPPHVHFSVFGTGFAQRLVTQCYFEGDPLIPRCPIVRTLPDDDAVRALTATLDPERSEPFDAIAWRFDVVLRGRGARAFENRPEGD